MPPEDGPDTRPGEPAQPTALRGTALVGLLTLGHLLNDFYATMITPILVELGKVYSLSISKTQYLPMWTAVFGSVAQPLVGVIGDRTSRKALVAVGSAVAAVFICCLGYAASFNWLVCLLIVGAVGVSLFHPNSASMVTSVAARRHLSFAVFLAGGTVGLALAPLVVTRIVSRTGDLRSLVWLSIPGVAIAVAFALLLPKERRVVRVDTGSNLRELIGSGTGMLWFLFIIVSLRSTVFTAFFNFMGHLCEQRGWTIHQRGLALSCFLGSSGLAGMIEGGLSDLTNRKAVLVLSCFVCTPLLVGFALATQYATAIVLLTAAGLAIGSATPMLVVIAQDLCPSNKSAASGMMMGLAWGVAGITLPLLGKAAESDAVGTSGVLVGVSTLAAVAGLLSLLLPSIEKRETR